MSLYRPTVDFRIFSFNLILAMDFLNKIAEFMTTGLQTESGDDSKDERQLAVPTPKPSTNERSSESIVSSGFQDSLVNSSLFRHKWDVFN